MARSSLAWMPARRALLGGAAAALAALWLARARRRRGNARGTAAATKPGCLILVRHGESAWNRSKTFTGWADVNINARGRREMEHAARLLLESGFTVDVAYTSRLKRAIRSTWVLLREIDQIYRPVLKSWRLNERMYGALTGLSKDGLAAEIGARPVQAWRHSLNARPPPLSPDHPLAPHRERKYADLPFGEVPRTESLQDCLDRTLPLWHERIAPELRAGRDVLVVAHGNSLRGLIKAIDQLTPEQIESVRPVAPPPPPPPPPPPSSSSSSSSSPPPNGAPARGRDARG